jgi:osmotically-inducible protein OsmY
MKTASQLQHDVLEELRWEPGLKEGEIGVSVHEGVVTLTGHVETLTELNRAERAVKRVSGVRGVANDLVVMLPSGIARDDTDIAEAALHALKWTSVVPEERIQVTVRNGFLTLEGEVEWFHQKEAALRAVHDLTGVKGVTNLISVTPRPTTELVKDRIEAAFSRSAEIDAEQVRVEVRGTRVILRGTVNSWNEYEQAEWAAWSLPGIMTVMNELTVEDDVPEVAEIAAY